LGKIKPGPQGGGAQKSASDSAIESPETMAEERNG